MAGRKKKEFSTAPYIKPRRKRPKPYNRKPYELRGRTGTEGAAVKSFWKEHTMDQVISMTPEQLDIEIDKYLEEFIVRQYKHNKRWNFPETLDFRKTK